MKNTKTAKRTDLTPDQRVADCSAEIAKALAKYDCRIFGEPQIVKASRVRLWLLQWIAKDRVQVEIKLQDNPVIEERMHNANCRIG